MSGFRHQYRSHRKHHHPRDDPMSRGHSEPKIPRRHLHSNYRTNCWEETMDVDDEYYGSEQVMVRHGSHNRLAFSSTQSERRGWSNMHNQSESDYFHSDYNREARKGSRGTCRGDDLSNLQYQSEIDSFHSYNRKAREASIGRPTDRDDWSNVQYQSETDSFHSYTRQAREASRGRPTDRGDDWSNVQYQSETDSFHSYNRQAREASRGRPTDRGDDWSNAQNQIETDSFHSVNRQAWPQSRLDGLSNHQSGPHRFHSSTGQARSQSRKYDSSDRQNQPDMFQSLTKQTRSESDMFHHNSQCYASDRNDGYDVDAGYMLNQVDCQSSDRNQQMDTDLASIYPSTGPVTDSETFAEHSDASGQVGHAEINEKKTSFVCKSTNQWCGNSLQFADRKETAVDLSSDENGDRSAEFDNQALTTSVVPPDTPRLSTPNTSLIQQIDTCTVAGENCLPVNSSEQKIDAIKAELRALDVKFNEIMMNKIKNGGKMTKEESNVMKNLRKTRSSLVKKIKTEAQRQSLENIQLSQKLQQQYKWTSEAQQSVQPVIQLETYEAQRVDIFKQSCELTSEIQQLEYEIEDMKSENMDSVNQLTLKQLRKKQNRLINNQNFLCKREKKLSAQQRACRTPIGIDPFQGLVRVSRNLAVWREIYGKETLNDSLCGKNITDTVHAQDSNIKNERVPDVPVTGTSIASQQGYSKQDTEEFVINDEIQQMEQKYPVISNTSKPPDNADSCGNITPKLSKKQRKMLRKQQSLMSNTSKPPENDESCGNITPQLSKKQRKLLRKQESQLAKNRKIADKVDSYVKKHDMQDSADSPYFLLSALTNLLLSKKHTNGFSQDVSEQNVIAASDDESADIHASCHLVYDIADAFDVTPQRLSEQQHQRRQHHMVTRQKNREQLLKDLQEFDDEEDNSQ